MLRACQWHEAAYAPNVALNFAPAFGCSPVESCDFVEPSSESQNDSRKVGCES
jgi:hypothetical protein